MTSTEDTSRTAATGRSTENAAHHAHGGERFPPPRQATAWAAGCPVTPTGHGPPVRQRRLASELRKLREAAGLTAEVAAGNLGRPRSKLTKIETARQIPTVADVEAILAAYGGRNSALGLALVELARNVRKRGWWVAFGDVLDGGFAELEDAATTIRIWQPETVPGLLQAPAYTRELITAEIDDPTEIERRVQARATRRARLERSDAPILDVMLTEEVLRRMVGGRPVMRQQVTALLRDLERPNVSIRIVPLEAGAFPDQGRGGLTMFQVFEAGLDLSVAYFEAMNGGWYVEDVASIRECRRRFDQIARVALSTEETAKFLARIRKELE
ncbi:helix-turn-helix domain-containing protein [Thermomonospora curvata]|uniref:helix-turn-helix domain-containing protein n=1 Tax=Thermomonospora curvata TaxID=2020 RepID=UPI001FE1CF1C|nr:helix-turn-helix transcriptional regulator [Thermomonospora curvata]